MRLIILGCLVSLSPGTVQSRRLAKLSRRQRILAMLENHDGTTRQPNVELADDPSLYQPTLPPIFNMWVTWDPTWSRRPVNARSTTSTPTTPTTKTTTTQSTRSLPDAWYYQDDWGQMQGPYSSTTMLRWEQEGYFR